MKSTSWWADAGRGAVSSVVASTAMGALMVAASRAGVLGEPPPRTLTRRLLRRTGPSALTRGAALDVSSVVAHLGYGAAAGALFSLLGRRLPSRAARVAAGLGYGTAVWAGSYAGWIPALGLMQPPRRDRPFRPVTMLIAHWVFGSVLASLLRPRQRAAMVPEVVKAEASVPLTESEQLDEALDESFPASDPPARNQPRANKDTLTR